MIIIINLSVINLRIYRYTSVDIISDFFPSFLFFFFFFFNFVITKLGTRDDRTSLFELQNLIMPVCPFRQHDSSYAGARCTSKENIRFLNEIEHDSTKKNGCNVAKWNITCFIVCQTRDGQAYYAYIICY
jgi:hypothetical protein